MPHLPGGSKTVHRVAGAGGNVTYARMHAHNEQIDEMTTVKMAEHISMAQSKVKPPNSPIGANIWRIGKVDGLENVADTSTVRTDVKSVENNSKKPRNTSKNIHKCQ